MYKLRYLAALVELLLLLCLSCGAVYGSENVTVSEDDVLANLTGNNDLWTILLKDCQEPTLVCVQNNIFSYLKQTLNKADDLQFNSYLKFTKNNLKYDNETIRKSHFQAEPDHDIDSEEEFPIESMARSLQENTAQFFMTHDLEVSLPDGILPNSVLKIAPKGFGKNGALVNLEIVSQDLEEARSLEEGGRTFKKIRQFINERIIYAILALLLIVKLLAFKFLFLLPLIIGAATAKKLLLKVLLFVFPFLHHIFKFCAYYPIQAKYHHHKHLISHIHQVAPHHDHHESPEVIGPHSYGPPIEHHGPHETHFTEFDDDVSVLPDDGSGFPHGPWLVNLIKRFLGKTLHWSVFVIPQVAKMAIRNPNLRHFAKQFINKSMYLLITYLPRFARMSLKLISHRKDPLHGDNEISSSYGQVHPTRRKPGRPLTSIEIERMIAKAEKEAIIKARLEKERLRIRDENLKLQEQLNQAIKHQEKLKQQHAHFNKKIPNTKITSSVPYRPGANINPPSLKGSTFNVGSSLEAPGIDLPAGYIPQHIMPQPVQQITYKQNSIGQNPQVTIQTKPSQEHGPIYKPQTPNSGIISNESPNFEIQKSVEYDPRLGTFDNSKEVQAESTNSKKDVVAKYTTTPKPKPKLEQEIYQAASITYDPFYSPILQKIDKILQGLGFIDEPCRERLICSMYKNPTVFSPHSNLISAELSRDANELQKPTSTNSAVIRFYKYVQAARDGQDQRDCLRLYPSCAINTEVS